MNATTRHRASAWGSAAIAAGGLLLLGWSPTELLLLYWLENAIYLLFPMLVVLAAALLVPGPKRAERIGIVLIVLFFMVVFGMFVGVHGFLVLVLEIIARQHGSGSVTGEYSLDGLFTPLAELSRDLLFLASAAAIAVSVVVDLYDDLVGTWRGGRKVGTSEASAGPSRGPGDWMSNMVERLLVTQAALIFGGAGLMMSGLPATAALLLVALKLWLDLRRARKREARS